MTAARKAILAPAVELERSKCVAHELENATPLYRASLSRAFAGTASPRAAIRAYCLTCVGCQRVEITNCRVLACPLWLYRPYQDLTAHAGEAAADAIVIEEGA